MLIGTSQQRIRLSGCAGWPVALVVGVAGLPTATMQRAADVPSRAALAATSTPMLHKRCRTLTVKSIYFATNHLAFQ